MLALPKVRICFPNLVHINFLTKVAFPSYKTFRKGTYNKGLYYFQTAMNSGLTTSFGHCPEQCMDVILTLTDPSREQHNGNSAFDAQGHR